jgi:hypothetical protein
MNLPLTVFWRNLYIIINCFKSSFIIQKYLFLNLFLFRFRALSVLMSREREVIEGHYYRAIDNFPSELHRKEAFNVLNLNTLYLSALVKVDYIR